VSNESQKETNGEGLLGSHNDAGLAGIDGGAFCGLRIDGGIYAFPAPKHLQINMEA